MAISREADYVWGTGATEQQRLLQQIELYAPYASWLLDRFEIKNGSRAIDLGCGLLGIVDLLSERAGPSGEVLGVELEPRFVEIAEKLLADRGMKNARVVVGDATSTRMPSDSFHVVHERLLLIVVTELERVISEMVRLAVPGGIVAVEEVDVGTWICEPPHPAWTRLFAAFEQVYTRDGKNVRIGRQLPGLLRSAGLRNVDCKAHAHLNGPGDFHQQQLLVFIRLFWKQIIDLGLVGEEELESLFRQLDSHLSDPGTLVVSPMLYQAWGYKS